MLKNLDHTVAVVTKLLRDRPPKPWINDEVLLARRTYRRCVNFWSKDESRENWTSVKAACNNYVRTLKMVKKDFYSNKILECKNNTKKLYHTIIGLVNREKVNPLPDRPSEELVAHFSDFFSDFFYDTVKIIPDKLKQFPNYIPPVRSTPVRYISSRSCC